MYKRSSISTWACSVEGLEFSIEATHCPTIANVFKGGQEQAKRRAYSQSFPDPKLTVRTFRQTTLNDRADSKSVMGGKRGLRLGV
jgi:hypothetical protein